MGRHRDKRSTNASKAWAKCKGNVIVASNLGETLEEREQREMIDIDVANDLGICTRIEVPHTRKVVCNPVKRDDTVGTCGKVATTVSSSGATVVGSKRQVKQAKFQAKIDFLESQKIEWNHLDLELALEMNKAQGLA